MVDYSKWKDIEISDDEDETPSLFFWREQARVERLEERRREKENHDKKKKENFRKLALCRNNIAKAEPNSSNLDSLKKALESLEKEEREIRNKEDDIIKKERQTPWNVDTISEPGYSKTVINTKAPYAYNENLSEEEANEKMKNFVAANEKLLKKFGTLRRYDDFKQFLLENNQLVCEETANYLVIRCIHLEMQREHELMSRVAHHTVCMQYILEQSKDLNIDPRGCVESFLSSLQADKQYKDSFIEELAQFKERIQKRAAENIQEYISEQEEIEKKQRLGPGGLDPCEVYAELPEGLKKSFETHDVSILKAALDKMTKEENMYYMKKCVDSGLFVPDDKENEPANTKPSTSESASAASAAEASAASAAEASAASATEASAASAAEASAASADEASAASATEASAASAAEASAASATEASAASAAEASAASAAEASAASAAEASAASAAEASAERAEP